MVTATRSALHTPLCDRLGIRVPICQAGMRQEIRRVRDLTDRPFGVDIQSAALIRDVRSAGTVVVSIVEEAESLLDRLYRRSDP
jgi:hypothetical protein